MVVDTIVTIVRVGQVESLPPLDLAQPAKPDFNSGSILYAGRRAGIGQGGHRGGAGIGPPGGPPGGAGRRAGPRGGTGRNRAEPGGIPP